MAQNPDNENRLQVLVEAGVAKSVSDFTPQAKKVILSLTPTEFQSALTIRKTILGSAGEQAVKAYDECMSFLY